MAAAAVEEVVVPQTEQNHLDLDYPVAVEEEVEVEEVVVVHEKTLVQC